MTAEGAKICEEDQWSISELICRSGREGVSLAIGADRASRLLGWSGSIIAEFTSSLADIFAHIFGAEVSLIVFWVSGTGSVALVFMFIKYKVMAIPLLFSVSTRRVYRFCQDF